MINPPRGRTNIRNVTRLGNTNIVRTRRSDSETAKLVHIHQRHTTEKVVPSDKQKVGTNEA